MLNQHQIDSLNKATSLCDVGDYTEARKQAQKVLNNVPENDSAEFVIAVCDEADGNLTRSIHYCRRAIKHAPDFRAYRIKLVSLLLADNQLEEAKPICIALVDDDNSDPYPLRGLALIHQLTGDPVKAFLFGIKVKRLTVMTSLDKLRLVENLCGIKSLSNYPGFDQDICDILDYDNINIDELAPFVSRHLSHKYLLTNDNVITDFGQLITDPLLLKFLRTLVMITLELETLLTRLRCNILNEVATHQTIDTELLPITEALALQNHLNAYVYLISDDEKHIIDLFSELLTDQSKKSDWSPQQSELVLLCLSMYGQLHEHPERNRLLQFPIEVWPSSLMLIADTTLFTIGQELELKSKIASISAVDDETSQLVRSQYESNPYPRWTKPIRNVCANFAEYMTAVSPGCTVPSRLKQPAITVLVAGCGTGREPINHALSHHEARITAVDISRRSLAYAQRKAQELGVNNIDFFHGDILNLPQIEQRFDLILCSGVLHHMAAPLTGWKILRDLLTTDGVLQISLYSAIARRQITTQRKAIEALALKPEVDQIRRYRHALMGADPNTNIIKFKDFWSLNECRDLLFHCKEYQFTWLEIAESLEQLNMELIGIHARKEVHQLYQTAFPNDTLECDLSNWHQLECDNPNLFSKMYSFWCRKKAA